MFTFFAATIAFCLVMFVTLCAVRILDMIAEWPRNRAMREHNRLCEELRLADEIGHGDGGKPPGPPDINPDAWNAWEAWWKYLSIASTYRRRRKTLKSIDAQMRRGARKR